MTRNPLRPAASLAGRWHLVAAEWHGDQLPEHRVDLVFHEEPAGLRGAILSRRDGSEIALQAIANWERVKAGQPLNGIAPLE